MIFKKEGYNQFIKFALVGVVNTLVNLAVLYILTDIFGIYYLVSAVFAFLIAVTNSFLLNKMWTFKESISYRASSKYIKFVLISVIALIINLIILYVLVEYYSIWYIYAQIVGVSSNLIINFFGNKLWTFKKH